MGKPSRDKGKRGENEVVEIFRSAGANGAKRTAALQAGTRHFGVEADADVWVADGFHVEVKRCETLRIPAWLRQLDRDCPESAEGILAFRRSRERWRALVSCKLLDELEDALDGTEGHISDQAPLSTVIFETDRRQVDLVGLAISMGEAGWLA